MSTTTTNPTLSELLLSVVEKAQAGAALKAAELHGNAEATDEQCERASAPPRGLKGKSLGVYVLTGERLAQQSAAAKAKRAAKGASTPKPRSSGPREGSALHAAITILKAARGPLTPQEIYDRAKAKGLAGGLKGKTPVATLAAQLATANKKGLYVERPAPGRYQIRKGAK